MPAKRNTESSEDRDFMLTLRLTTEELNNLNGLARMLRTTRSDAVRRLIAFDSTIFRLAFKKATGEPVLKGQEAAAKIRAEYAAGNVTLAELGEKYGYSESAVSLIVRGKRLARRNDTEVVTPDANQH